MGYDALVTVTKLVECPDIWKKDRLGSEIKEYIMIVKTAVDQCTKGVQNETVDPVKAERCKSITKTSVHTPNFIL
jgi:hypothetical protein